MRSFLILLLLVFSCLPSQAQIRSGIELQIYPAGQIMTGQLRLPVGDSYEFGFQAGYNRTRRRDWGKHENEHGDGPGGGVHILRFAGPEREGMFFGLRADIWSLDIDWTGKLSGCPDNSWNMPPDCSDAGTTSILVLQPTAAVGYRFRPKSLDLDLTLSVGREFNIRTDGVPVGEGMIGLAGLGVRF